MVVGSLALAASASALTFTVDVTTDVGPDALPSNGCEAAGGDECTFREAILKANDGAASADIITHAFGGQTVSVATPLPTLTQQTTITSAGGILGINGSGLAINNNCLNLVNGADNSVISNLALTDCSEGIDLNQADGVQIQSVHVGFNADLTPGEIGASAGFDGIELTNSDNVVIGGLLAGGNTISNVDSDGIVVDNASSGVQILGNRIGDVFNEPLDLGNDDLGISLAGANGVVAGNTIGGNGDAGIRVAGVAASGAIIRSNFIGINNGNDAVAPNSDGIQVDAGAVATIGGPTAADGNHIAGNRSNGVELTSTAGGSVLQNNVIGLDRFSAESIPNQTDGVFVQSPNNLIGTPGAGNLISGNDAQGIHLNNPPATGNRVEGNTIGLDLGGGAEGNGDNGVKVEQGASNNVIGSPAAPNTISANGTDGVKLENTNTTGNTVSSNLIGTNPAGAGIRGNDDDGVELDNTPDNLIEANLISGNTVDGVDVSDTSAQSNVIRGNVIGLNLAQTFALPNGRGILTEGANNLYSGNTIAGNILEGMRLGGSGTGNRVEGNVIGTNSAGTRVFPNGEEGIELGSGGAYSIGGPGPAANTITGNIGDGIAVTGTTAVATIAENSIFANDGLGIDIGPDGVTPNDAGDADTGPNGLQNSPELLTVTVVGNDAAASGTISTLPSVPVTIHFYSSAACDPSGSGEGQTPIGSITVSTDGAGNANFTAPVSSSVLGRQVTATATGPDGTSEYSACREGVIADPEPPVICQGREATIIGTDGKDKLRGTSKKDVISGLGGNDTISGLGGNDTVCGDGGNDVLTGGGGRDKLNGGKGRDRLNGGSGKGDLCEGGAGKDQAAKSCEQQRSA